MSFFTFFFKKNSQTEEENQELELNSIHIPPEIWLEITKFYKIESREDLTNLLLVNKAFRQMVKSDLQLWHGIYKILRDELEIIAGIISNYEFLNKIDFPQEDNLAAFGNNAKEQMQNITRHMRLIIKAVRKTIGKISTRRIESITNKLETTEPEEYIKSESVKNVIHIHLSDKEEWFDNKEMWYSLGFLDVICIAVFFTMAAVSGEFGLMSLYSELVDKNITTISDLTWLSLGISSGLFAYVICLCISPCIVSLALLLNNLNREFGCCEDCCKKNECIIDQLPSSQRKKTIHSLQQLFIRYSEETKKKISTEQEKKNRQNTIQIINEREETEPVDDGYSINVQSGRYGHNGEEHEPDESTPLLRKENNF